MEGWTTRSGGLDPDLRPGLLFGLVAWAVTAIGAADAGSADAPAARSWRLRRPGHRRGRGRHGARWWASQHGAGQVRRRRACWSWCPPSGWCSGRSTASIIAKGRLQPFIVTLAMMVGVLGVARLVAGQDQSVVPVYTGTNATAGHRAAAGAAVGRPADARPVLPRGAAACSRLLLGTTTFGRYVYAIGGNEQATRLSGVAVDRVKIAVYAFSGMLASLAGVLYMAQYRQGKPDAGEGIELDAIAAVVIGGTSLMGGKGSLGGTLVGVLIFGFLSNILQLNNIDSNTQLVLKGADHPGGGAAAGGPGRPTLLRPAARASCAGSPPATDPPEGNESAPSCTGPTGQPTGRARHGTQDADQGHGAAGIAIAALPRSRAFARTRNIGSASRRRRPSRPWRVQFNKDMKTRGREASRDRADHRRRPGQDREAGGRRRELHQPGRRRAADLAQGIGGPDAGGARRRSTPGSRSSCSTATSTPTSTRSSSAATTW